MYDAAFAMPRQSQAASRPLAQAADRPERVIPRGRQERRVQRDEQREHEVWDRSHQQGRADHEPVQRRAADLCRDGAGEDADGQIDDGAADHDRDGDREGLREKLGDRLAERVGVTHAGGGAMPLGAAGGVVAAGHQAPHVEPDLLHRGLVQVETRLDVGEALRRAARPADDTGRVGRREEEQREARHERHDDDGERAHETSKDVQQHRRETSALQVHVGQVGMPIVGSPVVVPTLVPWMTAILS